MLIDAVRELEAHGEGLSEDEKEVVPLSVRLGVSEVLTLEEAHRDAEAVPQGQGLGVVEEEAEGQLEVDGQPVGVEVAL